MTDQDFRTLNAELGFPPEAADRLLHDRRADERRASEKRCLYVEVEDFPPMTMQDVFARYSEIVFDKWRFCAVVNQKAWA